MSQSISSKQVSFRRFYQDGGGGATLVDVYIFYKEFFIQSLSGGGGGKNGHASRRNAGSKDFCIKGMYLRYDKYVNHKYVKHKYVNNSLKATLYQCLLKLNTKNVP